MRGLDSEMMDGRVKTLHPKIHGGLLCLRDNADHLASAQEHGIEMIDLVVVNLYPFEETVAREGVSFEEAVEQIDIGGPSMLRSVAKPSGCNCNLRFSRLSKGLEADTKEEDELLSLRSALAHKALIISYDAATCTLKTTTKSFLTLTQFPVFRKVDASVLNQCSSLWENPHQKLPCMENFWIISNNYRAKN